MKTTLKATTKTFRVLVLIATLGAAAAPSGHAWTASPLGPSSCTGEGLAQNECGNPQAIPDCEVTCFGKASCLDAQCDPIYEEGPLGHVGDPIAYFYLGPVCGCVGGWHPFDAAVHASCLAELFRRTDQHRSKVAKTLSRCELGVLAGRTTLPAGGTCADDDARTAAAIAASRYVATQAIQRKCPADLMTEMYGVEDSASATTFVDGLLRQAEGDAAGSVGLALRLAVVAP